MVDQSELQVRVVIFPFTLSFTYHSILSPEGTSKAQPKVVQLIAFFTFDCVLETVLTPKIPIFGVIYQPLELKIHPQVGLLRSKTMPKHFPNNSRKTLKKSRKRFFRPQKCSKITPQNRQNEQIIDRKFRFQRSFINLWS